MRGRLRACQESNTRAGRPSGSAGFFCGRVGAAAVSRTFDAKTWVRIPYALFAPKLRTGFCAGRSLADESTALWTRGRGFDSRRSAWFESIVLEPKCHRISAAVVSTPGAVHTGIGPFRAFGRDGHTGVGSSLPAMETAPSGVRFDSSAVR